jgi:hypothetical protein
MSGRKHKGGDEGTNPIVDAGKKASSWLSGLFGSKEEEKKEEVYPSSGGKKSRKSRKKGGCYPNRLPLGYGNYPSSLDQNSPYSQSISSQQGGVDPYSESDWNAHGAYPSAVGGKKGGKYKGGDVTGFDPQTIWSKTGDYPNALAGGKRSRRRYSVESKKSRKSRRSTRSKK